MPERLSSSLHLLDPSCDVIVVGSGYGASVAALRLAQAGRRVAVLERGRERQPGDYPESLSAAGSQFRIRGEHGTVGDEDALFDLLLGDDLHVLTGCGLGGTSQINASVALPPTSAILNDPVWPQALRADEAGWHDAMDKAEYMLAPERDPVARAKSEVLGQAAGHLGTQTCRPPLTITFSDLAPNRHGVDQAACTGCGNCTTGCNVSAKHALTMNYLPAAARAGARIFCEVQVTRVVRAGTRWQVFYRLAESRAAVFGEGEHHVFATTVVLGAGAVGSTEILLRSRAAGLTTSAALGTRFSGNGDVLAFAYDGNQPVRGIGRVPAPDPAPGPCISTAIDLRQADGMPDGGVLIEEGVLPGALAPIYAGLFAAASAGGADHPGSTMPGANIRQWLSSWSSPYRGPMDRTLTYLVMGDDRAAGQVVLNGERVEVVWPGAGDQPSLKQLDQTLAGASRALGATYLRNPIWSEAMGRRLITVHPLGGCPMGDDARLGVVDDLGRVYADTAGTRTHDGLHVLDGAIIPRALGVNPLLTITTLAERAMTRITKPESGPASRPTPGPAGGDGALPVAVAADPEAPWPGRPPGIRFTERMAGDIRAIEQGSTGDRHAPAEFVLTIAIDSLDAFLADPRHRAALHGKATIAALDAEPMRVIDGRFDLLTLADDMPETREMRYAFRTVTRDGRTLHVRGVKRIHDGPGADLWSDTTTLAVEVAADAGYGRLVAIGSISISLADFSRQLSTIDVSGASTVGERLETMARFGAFFAGNLYTTYGGALSRPNWFDPGAAPRALRPLNAPIPVVHPVRTGDGVELRMTRFHGGDQGPVLLLHGLGVSGRIFTTDTIDVNLVEYLCNAGFDCFVAELRVSIDLPAAGDASTGDDVARHDLPALVQAVRRISGRGTVQVLGHCYGGTTLAMALLRGMDGVGAVVFSQVSTDVIAPVAARLKAGLHLPDVLGALGLDTMDADTDVNTPALEKLLDRGLGLIDHATGTNRCRNPVCHRIRFLYSSLYQHANLNRLTHDHMHELFGIANLRTFRHLAGIVRRGHIVDADGGDSYLGDLRGLNRPTLFVHGAENDCYRPESTERAMARLVDAFGPGGFERVVIPGYGHIDCIFGRNAATDVYPAIARHLIANRA